MTTKKTTNQQSSELISVGKPKTKTKTKSPLEKEMAKFEKLIADIELLEKKLIEEKNAELLQKELQHKIVHPELEKLAKTILQMFVKMEQILTNKNASKHVWKNFYDYVLSFGAEFTDYYRELNDFVKKYNDIALSLMSKKERKALVDTIKNEYEGIDDEDVFDILNGSGEKAKAKFARQQQEYFKEQQLAEKHSEDKGSLSINEIYKSLAKKLHPDLETNENIKLAKEKFMQELSVAKNEKDLKTLLLLQQRAVKEFGVVLDTLYTLDKLKAFNIALKRSKEMLQSKVSFVFNSIFTTGKREKIATAEQITKSLKAEARAIKDQSSGFIRITNRMSTISHVEDMFDDFNENQELDMADFFSMV